MTLTREFLEAATGGVLQNRCFSKFCKFHRKTPVLESLYDKVALYYKKTPTQVFTCEICEIFKNTFFCRTPPVATSEGTLLSSKIA